MTGKYEIPYKAPYGITTEELHAYIDRVWNGEDPQWEHWTAKDAVHYKVALAIKNQWWRWYRIGKPDETQSLRDWFNTAWSFTMAYEDDVLEKKG